MLDQRSVQEGLGFRIEAPSSQSSYVLLKPEGAAIGNEALVFLSCTSTARRSIKKSTLTQSTCRDSMSRARHHRMRIILLQTLSLVRETTFYK